MKLSIKGREAHLSIKIHFHKIFLNAYTYFVKVLKSRRWNYKANTLFLHD